MSKDKYFINEKFSSIEELPERFCVEINNQFEFEQLMIFFDDIGVVWNSGKKASELKYNSNMNFILFNSSLSIKLELPKNRIMHSLYPNGKILPLSLFISATNVKKPKLKWYKNLEIDPFEEEDWGYSVEETLCIQESIIQESELYKYAFKYDTIEECRYMVKFFSDMGYQVHSIDNIFQTEIAKNWKCLTYQKAIFEYGSHFVLANDEFLKRHPNLIQLNYEEFKKLIKGKTINKIVNHEIDPFEEEDWGYTIQESNTEWKDGNFLIKINNNNDFILLMKFFDSEQIRWQSGRKASDGPDCSMSYYGYPYFINYKKNAISLRQSNRHNDTVVSVEDITSIKLKKNKNLEVDPFEEEDWGYTIQESADSELKVRDTVIVLDKLKDYIIKEKWSSNIASIIGNIYTIILIVDDKYFLNCKENYFVYKDCIQKVGEAKKNIEIDPFEEEDWGYTIESIKKIEFE